ncbi:MAG: hypothetical protein HXS47_05710 [Theionarchaea archaeon]|nr:hypothetical protein [Theionarchaea archaeon]
MNKFSKLVIFVSFFGIIFITLGKSSLSYDFTAISSLLSLFIIIHATIAALIFPNYFKRQKEWIIYPKKNSRYVTLYLYMYLLGIILSLFILIGLIKLTEFSFKINLMIFLFNILLIPPYLFLIIKKDTEELIEKITDSILEDLNSFLFKKNISQTIFKINELQRIIIQACDNHNYIAVEKGIDNLLKIYIESNKNYGRQDSFFRKIKNMLYHCKINIKTENLLRYEILRCYYEIGERCIQISQKKLLENILKHFKKIFLISLSPENHQCYVCQNIIFYLIKFGIKGTENHKLTILDKIMNILGFIGDKILIANSCDISITYVLKGLQDIGVRCCEEKIIHQCKISRNRIIEIARHSDDKIKEETYCRFWIVTAHMYWYIIGYEESNYELEKSMEKEFNSEFLSAIYKAIDLLHKEGEWTQERILKNFIENSLFFQFSK